MALNPHIVPTIVELLRDEFPDEASAKVINRLDELLSTATSNDDQNLVRPDGTLVRLFAERRTPDLPQSFYACVSGNDPTKR
jgi:hypothetical protein